MTFYFVVPPQPVMEDAARKDGATPEFGVKKD